MNPIISTMLVLGITLSAIPISPTIPQTDKVYVESTKQKEYSITAKSLQQTLNQITATSRKIGTLGEQQAAKYITKTFKNAGLEVFEQKFKFAEKEALTKEQITNKGINLVATKKTKKSKPDILVISAHYDTVSGTVGANDDASGMTVLLELAKAVSKLDTDTEIRFIAFSGEEDGLLGSTYYVNSLTDDEKNRMIGDIQLDMLGHYRSENIQINTPNGAPTLIGNMIVDNAEDLLGYRLIEKTESASDHMSFARNGIPAVIVMQNNIGVENHKVSDNTSIIDCKKLLTASDIVLETIKDVMSNKTKSLSKKAYEVSDMKNPSYIFEDETIFYFNENKQLNDGKAGGPGKLVGKRHDKVLDWHYEYYYYDAIWFDMEEALPTVFEYRAIGEKKFLLNIKIYTEKAGYSITQITNILNEKYGKPRVILKDNILSECIWVDSLHQKQYILGKHNNEWVINVSSAFYGAGETIQKYDLTQGIEKYKNVDSSHYKLLEFTQKLTGSFTNYIDILEVWTDGLSYQLGAEYLTNPDNNDKFTLRLDINDIFDKDGNFRNLDKTLLTFVHEYGHVITLNNTQVDIKKRDPKKFYYTKECFRDNSYIMDFYNKFWKSLKIESGASLYFEKPELFVSQYASQNVNEDIAESFMLFVLSNKPTGNSIAEQKIKFFYSYPELVSLRKDLRINFGYEMK